MTEVCAFCFYSTSHIPMQLKDYYSILAVPYGADKTTLLNAYNTITAKLGQESCNTNSPYYNNRLEVEEAYRILCVSISLKEDYNEAYQQSIAQGTNNYVTDNDWLENRIKQEHQVAINRIAESNNTFSNNLKTSKWWRSAEFGCLKKIIGGIILIFILGEVKICSRNAFRDAYSSNNTEVVFPCSTDEREKAEAMLQKTAEDINASLPKDINENITQYYVTINNKELIYEYRVDDKFFQEFRHQAMSKKIQMDNLRQVYKGMKPMIDLLIKTNRGLAYRYVCKDSKKVTEFHLTCKDLASLE